MEALETDIAYQLYAYSGMTPLKVAAAALALIPGVASCRVGLEANISPADYPLIRVVPSRLDPGKPYQKRTIATSIYFGMPRTNSEGLEVVYEELFWLEAAIIQTLRTLGGRYVETITDEDRLDAYKLMTVRCELVG